MCRIRFPGLLGFGCILFQIGGSFNVCGAHCSGALAAPRESHFGSGLDQFLLDDISCTGDETSLADCRHRGWGAHNCGSHEAAGVTCESQLKMIFRKKRKNNLRNCFSYVISSIRLVFAQSFSSPTLGPSALKFLSQPFSIIRLINSVCSFPPKLLRV